MTNSTYYVRDLSKTPQLRSLEQECTGLREKIAALEGQLARAQDEIEEQKSALRYHQALLENAPFDVSLKDCEGRYLLTNRAFERNVNCAREAIIGRTLTDLIGEEKASKFAETERRVIESGEVVDQELLTPALDGARPFRSVKFPIHDDQEIIVGVGTISFDLKQIKEAEAAAKDAQFKLAEALEALPDGIVLFDADDRLSFCNSRYHELHKTVADVMVPGAHIEDIIRSAVERGQHPDAVGRGEAWVKERLEAYRNPGTPFEQRLEDGRWLRVYERRTDDGGTIGVRVDITELKRREQQLEEVEQRLRDYLDASSDWFWEMDSECRFSYFSDRFEEVTGVPPEMLMGKTREETGIPGVDPEQWQGHLDNLANRRSFRDFRHPRALPDGSTVMLSINGKAMFDADGRFRGYRGTGRDITDLVRAEQQAHRAESLLTSSIESLSEFFVLADADDRLIMCNDVFRELNAAVSETTVPGTRFEDHLRAALAKGLFPEAVGREEVWLQERIERHENPGGPFEVERQDGQWLLLREQRMPNGGIVTIGTDITDRKRFELELRQARDELEIRVEERTSELNTVNQSLTKEINERERAEQELQSRSALLQTLIEAIPTPVFFKDSDHIYIGCNPAFEAVLGRPTKDIIGMSVFDVAPPDLAEVYRQADDELMRRGGIQVYETQVEYADGSRHDVIFHKAVFGSEGESGRGIVGVILDITDRTRAEAALREQENLLRTIIDNSPSIIALKDLEGRYLLVNMAYESSRNRSIENLIGQSSYDNCTAAHAAAMIAQDREVIETGEVVTRERDTKLPNGTQYRRIVTTFPTRDVHGQLVGVGTISTDVTQLKEAEEQLQQAQKMEAVGQLTGGVAHDFNNLLTIVLGNLELVNDRYRKDELAQKCIQSAIRATKRGADLTQRLLAFSRKQALVPVVIDLGELIPQSTQFLQRTLGEDIEIALNLTDDLLPILADRNQLENAILNIALNARDAMPSGGRLTIESAIVELDEESIDAEIVAGRYAELTIRDTGLGMDSDVLGHAFEPFFTTKDIGQGSGLGLSMVYGFARQSGGHARILSEPGRGTQVRLLFPRLDGAAPKVESDADGRLGMPFGCETILVVEDDPDVRDFVVVAVQALGYRVFEAADGPAALAILDQIEELDLLLSDVVLPGGMNGREVAAAVGARYPQSKLLFMSGYPRDAIVHQGRLDDGVALLTKPYTRAELAEAVREVLDTDLLERH